MMEVKTNGAKIPSIGLGTWDLRGAVATKLVTAAIQCGYRHIDTAQRYENEREVGEGMRNSGIDRSEVFLTSKIWPDHYAPKDFQRAAEERLELLNTDYLDLLLLHWPSVHHPLAETIELLNSAKQQGLARHIGVSNFTAAMVNQASVMSSAPLVCNQIEYHPFLSQTDVIQACNHAGIAITAYCPIARGQVLDEPIIVDLATKYGKSPIQITLRWLVAQSNVIAIPRTSKISRVSSNIDIFDFELTAAESKAIDALGHVRRRLVNLDIAPDWD